MTPQIHGQSHFFKQLRAADMEHRARTQSIDTWQSQIDEAIAEQEERAKTAKVPTVQSIDESGESIALRLLLGVGVAIVFVVLVGVIGMGMWAEAQALKEWVKP